MKTCYTLVLLFAAIFTFSPAMVQAEEDYHLGFRIAPRISTLGGGLEVAKGLTPWLGLRVGGNYFKYSYDGEESGNKYELELELKNAGLLIDIHPFKQAFRITGGVMYNGNILSGITQGTWKANDNDYPINNPAYAELSFPNFAPYAGIGWDTTYGDDDNWGFTFDIGVVFTGTPELALDATLDSTATIAQKANFEADKSKEMAELQDSLNDYELWPVISAGIVYQF